MSISCGVKAINRDAIIFLVTGAELTGAKSRELPKTSSTVSKSPEPPPAFTGLAAAAAVGRLANPRALRVEAELPFEMPSPSTVMAQVQTGLRPEAGKRGLWSVMTPQRAARERERQPHAVPDVLSDRSSESSSSRSASSARLSDESSDSDSHTPSPVRALSLSKRGASYIGIEEPHTLTFSTGEEEHVVAPVSIVEEGEELQLPLPGERRQSQCSTGTHSIHGDWLIYAMTRFMC